MKTIIGITGGYAAGKTTVADMFVSKGARKIDADEIGHQLLFESRIKDQVLEIFGDEILTDARIDRKKLAKRVFSDKDELESLCNILHPEIIRRVKEVAESAGNEIIVIDAPLLIEAGLHEYVDKVIVVTAKKETRIKRAADRGVSGMEAEKIIDTQMPLSEKVKFADYIIDNNNGLEITKEGVEKIWQEM